MAPTPQLDRLRVVEAMRAGWLPVALIITLLLTLLGSAAEADDLEGELAWIHPDLSAAVSEDADGEGQDEPLQVVLVLRDRADLSDVEGDRDAVVERLQDTAYQSQQSLYEELEASANSINLTVRNSLWITNVVLVEVVPTAAALDTLADLPQVERLVPDYEFHTQPTEPEEDENAVGPRTVDDRTWGIDRIGAHQVWDELGLDGSGVRVAVLDTGVDITHPDLEGKLATDDPSDPAYPGGWMEFDDVGNLVASEPHDSADHGTHVSGTVAGGDDSGIAIGVAPGAELMHGLVIPEGSGDFIQVAAGMQWALEPVDADENPVGEPADIVNMSLGANDYIPEMVAPTQALRAADIFPSFSAGNAVSGSCGVGHASPGNVYEAVAIGMTDVDEGVSEGSCGGIADWPAVPGTEDWPDTFIKPDLSAPGVGVHSAVPGDGYDTYNGTSMAAPHVSGTVALLREADPDLTVDDALQALVEYAFFDDRYGEERPNERYGYGRIEALGPASLIAIPNGIVGEVTDADDETPIAGAEVSAGSRTVESRQDGSFHLPLDPGTYDVAVEAFAYEQRTVEDIVVETDAFTDLEVDLVPSPAATVTGEVTYSSTGTGIPGVVIDLIDTPLQAVTDADGHYTLEGVPEGSYSLNAQADGFADVEPVDIGVPDDTNVDFNVDAFEPSVGVIATNNQIVDLLDAEGVGAERFAWGEEGDVAAYSSIIVDGGDDPGADTFTSFIRDTDHTSTGVVLTDTDPNFGNGIWLAQQYLGNPSQRDSGWVWGLDELTYEVLTEHPIVEGHELGDTIVHNNSSSEMVYAWFDGYQGDGVTIIADAARSDTGVIGSGIAAEDRANNGHALLSLHGSATYTPAADWEPASVSILLNALEWAGSERDGQQTAFVVSELELSTEAVLPDEPATVNALVTNVGASEGSYTTDLWIDGEPEDGRSVELGPGESERVSWDVTRQEFGSYQIEVGYLTDSLRIRPPELTVDVAELHGEAQEEGQGLEDAEVLLVADGEVFSGGATDENGVVVFESPVMDEDVVIVVQREGSSEQGKGYLLERPLLVDGDQSVEFRPDLDGEGWDESAVVDLAMESVADDHQGWTYLAGELIAPLGFAVEPGEVVMPAGEYEARHVHALPGTVRDWWFAGDQLTLNATGGQQSEHEFGGQAALELGVESDDVEVTADWAVTDAYGIEFAIASATEASDFNEVPEWHALDGIDRWLSTHAPYPADITAMVRHRSGEAVNGEALSWDERSVTRDVVELTGDDDPIGYRLHLQAEIGAWGADVDADALIPYQPWRRLPSQLDEASGDRP